ncbi:hypothetical protein ACFP81_09380 [Deinococcus lacus]|uniref:Transposase n=1 Tax=Deinococcus lacus TaxID=392561 RepID=A0ABW1YG14_9DEIO
MQLLSAYRRAQQKSKPFARRRKRDRALDLVIAQLEKQVGRRTGTRRSRR